MTAAPTTTVLAADGFGRSATGGWGAADTGGAWSVTGGAARFSVAGGAGLQSVPSGVTTTATLPAVSATATDLVTRLSLDTVPNGPVYASATGRRIGAGGYAARVKVLPGGAVELAVTRTAPGLSESPLAGGTLTGVTLAPGQQLLVRV